MLMTQYTASPAGGDTEKLRPKFRRTPLLPKNSSPANRSGNIKTRPKLEPIRISLFGEDDSNKENRPPFPSLSDATPKKKIESLELDSSLAEELSAIRKKLERLSLDRERTDKMLDERDSKLQIQMKELHNRGQAQRQLEIEVDRLYRLNELRSYCMRFSPIRSLRAKEQAKVKPIHHHHHEENSQEQDLEESVGENVLQSPDSEEVTSEIAPESVAAEK